MEASEKRPGPVGGRTRPDGAEDVDEREDRQAHGPPEAVPELSELDALWEHLVITLPALPNR